MSNQKDPNNKIKEDIAIVNKIIGRRLRKIRKEKGYSNIQQLNFDKKFTYPYIERGMRDVRLGTLAEVCQVFEISLEDLFKDISLEIKDEMAILEIKKKYD